MIIAFFHSGQVIDCIITIRFEYWPMTLCVNGDFLRIVSVRGNDLVGR